MFKIINKSKKKVTLTVVVSIVFSLSYVAASYSLTFLYSESIMKNANKLIENIIIVITMYFISMVLLYIKIALTNDVLGGLKTTLRLEISKSILKLDYKQFNDIETGNYVSWYTNDVEHIAQSGFSQFFVVLENIFSSIFALVLIGYTDIYLSIVAIILLGVMFLIPKKFEKSMELISYDLSIEQEKFLENIKDLMYGINIMRVYSKFNLFKSKLLNESIRVERTKVQHNNKLALISTLITFTNVLCQTIMIVVTVLLVTINRAPIGSILSIAALSGTFFSATIVFINSIVKIKSIKPILNKFNTDCENVYKNTSNEQLSAENLNISARNISFEYANSKILENLNIDIEYGKNYVIVGESGSGKSTLAKILSGLLKNYKGLILYDGKNRKNILDENIFNKVGYIDQNTYLFNGTLRYNLCFDEFHTDEYLQEIISTCKLDELIERQSLGLDTYISDNGKKLSGGEKQRISLARALLSNKKILFIDEGTSAIDRRTSLEIEKMLIKRDDTTMIIITHHLNNEIKNLVDFVYRIEDKSVICV